MLMFPRGSSSQGSCAHVKVHQARITGLGDSLLLLTLGLLLLLGEFRFK